MCTVDGHTGRKTVGTQTPCTNVECMATLTGAEQTISAMHRQSFVALECHPTVQGTLSTVSQFNVGVCCYWLVLK